MTGDELVKEIVKKLSKLPGLSVHLSDISRMGKVYLLDGKFKGHIYIKLLGEASLGYNKEYRKQAR
jgi:hypothetical protein